MFYSRHNWANLVSIQFIANIVTAMDIVMICVRVGVIKKRSKRIKNKVLLIRENWIENDSETKKSKGIKG